MSTRRKSRSKGQDHGFVKRNSAWQIFSAQTVFGRLMQTMFGLTLGFGIIFGLLYTFNQAAPPVVEEDETSYGGQSDYEYIRDQGSLLELNNLLNELADWPKDGPLPVRIQYLDRRITIANKLLSHENATEKDKIDAAKAKIEAIGAYYALDFINRIGDPFIVERTEEISNEYYEHADAKLATEAQLLKAKVSVFEYVKKPSEPKLNYVKECLTDVSTRHSESEYVFANTGILLRRLVSDFPEQAVPLANEIVKIYNQNSSARLSQSIDELNDNILITQSKISEHFHGDWVGTAVDQQGLQDKVVDLAKRIDTGRSMIDKMIQAIAWFENMDRYDAAREVCQVLVDSAAQRENREVANYATQVGQAGLKRLNIIGKKWNFEGLDQDGNPINVSEYENMICLIFFWSHKNPKAMRNFTRIDDLYRELRRRGIRILTVPIDDFSQTDQLDINPREVNSIWQTVLSVNLKPETNPYLQQFPVSKTPYMVLIDREGIVRDINVKMSQLRTDLSNIMSQ